MPETPKVETVPIEEDFPSPMLPTIFCDGIANLAPSAHVMKFYLYRSDPDQAGKPIYTNQILAQVVMPISAFIFATFFFDKSLKLLVQQGAISSDMVDKIEQIVQGEQQT